MEPVKHSEWAVSVLFFSYGTLNYAVTATAIILIVISSQLPDVLELVLNISKKETTFARHLSHSFLFSLILFFLGFLILNGHFFEDSYNIASILYYFGFGSAIHIILDAYGGGEGIFLFYPVSSTWKLSAISKNKRRQCGLFVKNSLGGFVKEETNADLAWFWLFQILGVFLVVLSIIFYLLIARRPLYLSGG